MSKELNNKQLGYLSSYLVEPINFNTVENAINMVQEQYDELNDKYKVLQMIKKFDYNKVKVCTMESRKFKSYNSVFYRMILGAWNEDFKDEDTGEVVTIERHETIGYLNEDGCFFSRIKINKIKEEKKFEVEYIPKENDRHFNDIFKQLNNVEHHGTKEEPYRKDYFI